MKEGWRNDTMFIEFDLWQRLGIRYLALHSYFFSYHQLHVR